MLPEALAWLFTPASRLARQTGHLSETIAILARERRCRAAWRPHLEASQGALIDSARLVTCRRIALVLGSGPLLDVPLHELSGLFGEVWLVDMVHPRRARRLARRHANVRLIEHDVTECLADPSAEQARPMRFLDEDRIDWVASVNMLSQLPIARGGMQAGDGGEIVMARHLSYLSRFQAPICLLADLEQVTLDAEGRVETRTDFSPLLAGWKVQSEWRWDVAPPGELGGGLSRYHRVAALAQQREHEDQDDVGQAEAQVDTDQSPDPVQHGACGWPVLGRNRPVQLGIRPEINERENTGHEIADACHDMDMNGDGGHAAHLQNQHHAASDQQEDGGPDPGEEAGKDPTP